MSIFICPKCKLEIKSCREKHVLSCNGEGTRRKRPKKGRRKTLSENHRNNISKELRRKYENGEEIGFQKWMRENPELHKKLSSKGGGLKKGSGQGIKGWYKGLWCDSSWELAFVIYHLDKGDKIERNQNFFKYKYLEKNYKYYPDFILNGEYAEVKGYENEKAKEKKKQFPYKLQMIYAKEMKPILNYVYKKYGKNFIKLYE